MPHTDHGYQARCVRTRLLPSLEDTPGYDEDEVAFLRSLQLPPLPRDADRRHDDSARLDDAAARDAARAWLRERLPDNARVVGIVVEVRTKLAGRRGARPSRRAPHRRSDDGVLCGSEADAVVWFRGGVLMALVPRRASAFRVAAVRPRARGVLPARTATTPL